jgi:hypothetical protein
MLELSDQPRDLQAFVPGEDVGDHRPRMRRNYAAAEGSRTYDGSRETLGKTAKR